MSKRVNCGANNRINKKDIARRDVIIKQGIYEQLKVYTY